MGVQIQILMPTGWCDAMYLSGASRDELRVALSDVRASHPHPVVLRVLKDGKVVPLPKGA